MRVLILRPYSVHSRDRLLYFFHHLPMKKNRSFTLGAAAGATALVIAVPLLAQFAGAQSSSPTATTSAPTTQSDTHKRGHMFNGITEELLTGDNAAKATDAALKAVPGGTVDRVETDAEGDAYEAHMTKADGSRVTVKFDSGFNVTKTEDGPMGGRGGR